MKTRVLIVDDEQPARKLLRSLLAGREDIEVIGEADSGEEALQLASDLAPDIVLLDVRMPGMDGLQAARHMAALAEPPAVIFTTAYDNHALEAFDAQAIAYLLKPVRREKLAAAITQAGRLTRPQLQQAAVTARIADRRSHIAVRERQGVRLIPVEEVRVFQADQKYTTVRHADGEHLIEESLRALEEEFGSQFVRIHRSSLVSARHIEAIERDESGQYFVRLRGMPERLSVSRRMAGELRERFRI
ncbi:MAG: response regulator transcription factor [Gammaproteobacteria bacterium]|nr:response regulator transcription factor [Gammaproteobacteria bacterium]